MLTRPLALALLLTPALAQDLDVLWQVDDLTSSASDQRIVVAALPDGGAWVVGWGTAPAPGQDTFLVRVAEDGSAGAPIWIDSQVGPNPNQSNHVLTHDGAGGVYLAVRVGAGSPFGGPGIGGRDIALARYDAQGTLLWATRAGTPTLDWVGDIEVHAQGTIGLILNGNLTFFDSAGSPAGSASSSVSVGYRALSIAGNGDWLAAGQDIDPTQFILRGVLTRFTPAGTFVWQVQSTGFDSAYHAVVPDGAGGAIAFGERVLAFGYGPPTVDMQIDRYDAQGNVVWGNLTQTPSGANSYGVDLARTEAGTVLALFQEDAPVFTGSTSASVARLDVATGELDFAERRLLGHDTGELDTYGHNIELDDRGTAWVAGSNGNSGADAWLTRLVVEPSGITTCAGQPNSLAIPARANAYGTPVRSLNDLTVYAVDLPAQQPGYFLTSLTSGFISQPGGSQGDLCLGGAIGRINAPGQVQSSGALGRFQVPLDLGALPQPMGTVSALAGQDWFFQCWYRDVSGGVNTSNFTSAVRVTLQ